MCCFLFHVASSHRKAREARDMIKGSLGELHAKLESSDCSFTKELHVCLFDSQENSFFRELEV